MQMKIIPLVLVVFLNKLFSVYLFLGYGWFGKIDTGFSLQPENIFTFFFLHLTSTMQRDQLKVSGIDPVMIMSIASSKAAALNYIF